MLFSVSFFLPLINGLYRYRIDIILLMISLVSERTAV